MYPVLSTLRRGAAKLIYVRPEHTLLRDDRVFVKVKQAAPWVDLAAGSWEKPSTHIPLFTLSVRGSSPEAVAKSLTIRENEIGDAITGDDILYTLIVAPEEQVEVDGKWLRTFRAGVVRGVWAADEPELHVKRPKQRAVVQFRRLPPGTVKM